jgi:hypothetical protein
MEIRVNVAGKAWVVPQAAIAGLVSWLQQNAVELGSPKTEIREVTNHISNNRQLIMEDI